jgi:hypothetical protein
MSTAQIFVFASIALDLILIIAYLELFAIKRWYQKQFQSKPRAYKYVEKYSWQRRLVDLLLLRRPVSIKQPFKLIDAGRKNHLIRMEPKMGSDVY